MRFRKVLALLLLMVLMVGCQATPGTLPDPKSLPAADKSDVGNTVTLSMDKFLTQELGQVTGRLGVFTYYDYERLEMMLTVYEPVWAGIEYLIPSIDAGFEAKIVDRAIVCYQEYYRLFMASYRLSDNTGLKEDEIITKNAKNAGDGLYWYFGHMVKEQKDPKAIELQSGCFVSLVGNTEEAAGENVSTGIRNLKETAKRFKLEASFGI